MLENDIWLIFQKSAFQTMKQAPRITVTAYFKRMYQITVQCSPVKIWCSVNFSQPAIQTSAKLQTQEQTLSLTEIQWYIAYSYQGIKILYP